MEDYGLWHLICPNGNFSVNLVNPQDTTTTSRPSTDPMEIFEDKEKMVSSKDPCPHISATTSLPESVSETVPETVSETVPETDTDTSFDHTFCIVIAVVSFLAIVSIYKGAKKWLCKSTEPSERVQITQITKKSPPSSPMKN